jgi:hypothetical protein
MMRVDRAATSEESADHFDNAQSWDDATFSLPLRHSTLTLTHNDALLGGFVRYLQDSDQQALRELYQLVFGNFGVGASRLDGTDRTAFLTVFGLSRPNASTVPGTSRDAAYQAYTQWFRSWPWFHRFIGAIRHSARMRRAMWAYELVMCDRVVGRIQGWNAANVDGRNLWSYLGRQAGNARVASATANEFEMAVGLRLWVRAHSLVDDWSDWLQEVHDVLGRTTTPQERISTIILGRNQTPADIANIGNSLGGPVTPAAPTTPRPPDPGGGAQWDQAMAAHTQAQNERNRLLAAIGNLQTLSKKIDSIRDWFNVALPNGLATALSNAGPTAAERQTAIDNATNSAVHEGLRD